MKDTQHWLYIPEMVREYQFLDYETGYRFDEVFRKIRAMSYNVTITQGEYLNTYFVKLDDVVVYDCKYFIDTLVYLESVILLLAYLNS